MSVSHLLTEWRQETEVLRRHLAPQAEWLAARAAELEGALRSEGEELLTIQQAAAESGYSTDHLERLLREKKLPNAGRRGAPRVRRADVPRRPTRGVAAPAVRGYDPDADARMLLGRQGER